MPLSVPGLPGGQPAGVSSMRGRHSRRQRAERGLGGGVGRRRRVAAGQELLEVDRTEHWHRAAAVAVPIAKLREGDIKRVFWYLLRPQCQSCRAVPYSAKIAGIFFFSLNGDTTGTTSLTSAKLAIEKE